MTPQQYVDKVLFLKLLDWRVRLFDNLHLIETQRLKKVRADLVQTTEDIDLELERRGEPKS